MYVCMYVCILLKVADFQFSSSMTIRNAFHVGTHNFTFCYYSVNQNLNHALWSPAEKGLTSWLSGVYVMFSCAYVTFPYCVLG